MHRVLLILMALAAWSRPADGCSRVGPMPIAQTLVSRADAIVVATAVRYQIEPLAAARARIEFHVDTQIVGRAMPVLIINGRLVRSDDFNDQPPPYWFVRPAGRHGDCYASDYKEGAQFLLLLKFSGDGSLTPYREALAPTNEQLRGPDDPWLRAVRGFATAAARK